ncbi:MAG: putative dehydrogenase [Sphingomonas bacterium]|uniref:NAD(P)H-dependent oxidoreductase n=1 Tax=Sphingomonas bacterium TaxID=1895847 RepID=UPI002603589B|nr:NAD(P)H-dependent oxidoreductase [Sphingomonas bacterium]MDB5712496.1 putative dehydrogenase [Sphingomonas bacterium]
MTSEAAADQTRIRHVVILGHPEPGSFNHQVAEAYCRAARENGHEAVIRDLYELGFDPCLRAGRIPGHSTGMSADVARELGFLREADVVVFVYPIWFGMPPAIIKGYVDRAMGVATTPKDVRDEHPDSILAGKSLATFSSSATTRIWLDEKGQMEAIRRAFDRYLTSIFGMVDAGHLHFGAIVEGMNARFVGQSLLEVEENARSICSKVAAARHASKARGALERAGAR